MALADRAKESPRPDTGGLPCSLGAVADTLPQDERDALDSMLYDYGWTANQVYDALTAEGYTVGFRSINRHRRGECRCYRQGAAR